MLGKTQIKYFAKVSSGQGAPQRESDFSNNGIPFIRAGSLEDLLNGKQETELPKVNEEIAREYRLKLYQPDTIVFAKSGMSALKGRIYKLKNPCYVVNHLATIELLDSAIPDYVVYTLRYFSPVKLINDNAYPSLKQSVIENYEVPFPRNKEDQFYIANLLSKSEILINQRKESIRLLDEFLKSTFLEMFGDPVINQKNWKKGKVITYTDCIVPGRDKPKSFTGNVPWFTTEDLIHKGYVTKSKKGLGLSLEEIKQVRARVIPTGSVLLTCVGDLGVISVCKEDCVVNQQLHAFICKDEINNLFLMYALSFQKIFMYKKATSTTVPYMNKTTCNSIPVIAPPIALQTQFAQIVEKTEVLKTQYQQSLQELEQLYGSLSQKAFKGELNVKQYV